MILFSGEFNAEVFYKLFRVAIGRSSIEGENVILRLWVTHAG